jgi:hypothetical protein
MAPPLNQGYWVIMDNLFLSQDLFQKLCSKQTDAKGTLHQNKNCVPTEIKSVKLEKGEHVLVFIDRLMIMKGKNKKRYLSY